MSAHPSISSRTNVLRARIDELTERERMLLDALQETRAGLAKARGDLADTERARQGPRVRVAEATWRRVVRGLGTFTVSELASELGCTKQTASKHLMTMIATGMVKPAGRVMGKKLYAYQRPEGEGEAFHVQQRHLAAVPEPQVAAQPVAGVSNRTMLDGVHKDIRRAAQEAMSRGWELRKRGAGRGAGHWVLVKASRRAPFAGTPANPTAEADRIRRMTRER